ncbi:MAG: hypothetical protein IT330_05530 [Anaerolineae bacterium]|nr:hypothetical protein [Anaerolineae bacterium]
MNLDNQLGNLESSGLIRLIAADPELEYLFRHALVQETAYASLLKQDRRHLHLAAADALERIYPDRLEELAPVLGQHFYEARDNRALKYLTMAGDADRRKYANTEAVGHYLRALEIAKRGAASSEEFIHLYTSCGRALELDGKYDEAVALYAEIQMLAEGNGDHKMRLAALMACATIYSALTSRYDPTRGKALSQEALTLARETGDREAEAKILWNLSLVSQSTSHIAESIEYGEESLAIARELGLQEQLGFTLNDVGRSYVVYGKADRARAALLEAREIWQALGNLPMLAENLTNTSMLHFFVGEYDQAIAAADEAYRLSQVAENEWGQAFSLSVAGYVYFDRGQMDRFIAGAEESIRLGEEAGSIMSIVGMRALLGWAYGLLGAVEQGLGLAHLALEKAQGQLRGERPDALVALAYLQFLGGNLGEAEATIAEARLELNDLDPNSFAFVLVPLVEGEIALARKEYTRAIGQVDGLITALQNFGMHPFLADAFYIKGEALTALGRGEEACEVLRQARAEAEAHNSHRILWRILFSLSQVERGQGNQAEAEGLRNQARGVVLHIADHAGSPTLRASFLRRPQVHAVLANG